MKIRTTLILLMISAVVIGTSATMPQAEDKPAYKNLKVLPKKITKDELDKVMRHYNAALGVKCNFCHVRNEETRKTDYASDSKQEKIIARDMMRMTKKLNIKNFGAKKEHYNPAVMEVSCNTCHRGKTHPES